MIMRLNEIIKRELEVAFSKQSQPAWFRISKYILLVAVLYFLWGSKWLWTIVLSMLGVALLLHFWYRYKTNGWTKSYGMWKYDKKN
jgi:hypothetical protein